jgi:hypothetical protein
VAGLFDLPLSSSPTRELFERFALTIEPGSVVLITGPSGAGKSTILRGIGAGLRGCRGVGAVRLEAIGLPTDRPVVDCFEGSLDVTLGHLARAGLSEAQVLLRAPAELSEGQRFRYRLARFFASEDDILLADEFAATLDRVTAKILAFQMQKFIRATRTSTRPKSAIVATTHEDLAEDLRADVCIYKELGEAVRLTR